MVIESKEIAYSILAKGIWKSHPDAFFIAIFRKGGPHNGIYLPGKSEIPGDAWPVETAGHSDYRKHGQFEWTPAAILFACLIFTMTAPTYIWSILGM